MAGASVTFERNIKRTQSFRYEKLKGRNRFENHGEDVKNVKINVSSKTKTITWKEFVRLITGKNAVS